MATIDDVEQGVCGVLAGVLFPGQAYLPGAVATCTMPWSGAVGAPAYAIQAKLYVGEPVSAGLEADILAGVSNIGVMRVAGATRDVTRVSPYWIKTSSSVPTLVAAAGNGAVTFGGVAGAGQVVGVTAGGTCYAYRTAASDNPATVAAAFASFIPAAAANGAVLTAASVEAANVVADQTAFWQTGQNETQLQVAIIAVPFAGADGPLVRAALTRAVYAVESTMRPNGSLTRFIGLPDGTTAQIMGSDERDDDTVRRDDMWRRWITFRITYDVGISQVQSAVLAPLIALGTNAARIQWAGNGAAVSGVLTDGAGHVLTDASGDLIGVY
jgi:hypothetical protein